MASSPSATATERFADVCFQRTASRCVGLHRLYLHFLAQAPPRQLHLRITGTVMLQRAW